ncbi:hypothetical protein ACFQZX_07680 [Mucilaginibacter litoreus]|uniref:Uncharacterized protein n=1 Tax=Mucilaginibacter litoreus TaxID=1048221 RepID=A0ABW3ARL2_9SPHI
MNTNDPAGTIPVKDAETMIANWQSFLNSNNPDFIAQSFLTPIISFQNLLKYNPDAESVRIYIGLENAADPLSAKLMFIPVVNGKEVRTLTAQTGTDTSSEEIDEADGDANPDQSNVYDLTNACPPACP